VTLLLFLYVTEEAGRKCVWDMPWPLAAECNMITIKQIGGSDLNLNLDYGSNGSTASIMVAGTSAEYLVLPL